MNAVDWSTLFRALSFVERSNPNESGLLSFGTTPLGGIFVERGRVCWVAALGLQRRLRDLIKGYAKDVDALDRVSERCRAEGLLLGQTLVAEGLLQASDLEITLRRHSAECLVELCSRPRDMTWASHAGRGYSPRFTFGAKDLLFDSIALFEPELQLEARAELALVDEPGRRSVAFLMSESFHSLLPIAEIGGSGVAAMFSLGESLAGMPRASHELATKPAFALSATGVGDATLTWWTSQLLFAVSCADRASLARVIAQRMERR